VGDKIIVSWEIFTFYVLDFGVKKLLYSFSSKIRMLCGYILLQLAKKFESVNMTEDF
jgi:hypothetical protein